MESVKAFFHDWRLVLLIIHVGVTAALIVVILLQRSEGGGLGMASRTDALFSVRGQANVLSRMTAIFAGIFFFLSLLMAWSVGDPGQRSTRSIMDNVPASAPAPAAPAPGGATAPAPGGGASAPGGAAPATPSAPTAPTR